MHDMLLCTETEASRGFFRFVNASAGIMTLTAISSQILTHSRLVVIFPSHPTLYIPLLTSAVKVTSTKFILE
jgi:hypothetical protein